MFNWQLTISNAYGLGPTFSAPEYIGTTIPHLNFSIGQARSRGTPFIPSAPRSVRSMHCELNNMCLIEFPEYDTGHQARLARYHNRIRQHRRIL